MGPLELVTEWPVATAAAGVTSAGDVIAQAGSADQPFALASVTKVLVAVASWVAVEEETLDLEAPAGPEGSTVRHLLAHASGLAPDSETRATSVGARRIYSNAGFEVLGRTLAAAAGMDVGAYVAEAVCQPLRMSATTLDGSPAHGASSTVADLLRLGRELLAPRLVSPSTLAEATSAQFPDLAGVLPGFGRQKPNPWGLGVELRGAKSPHWTGSRNSPATFGHFGRSGTFLWVDPTAGLATVVLTDTGFGPWAAQAWPELSDAVLAAYTSV